MIPNEGKLQEWNDEKGYGFIVPDDPGRKVFAHIHEFTCQHPRPRNGDRVHYQTAADSQGRSRAVDIRRPQVDRPRGHPGLFLIPILVYAVWIGLQTWRGVYPKELPIALGVLSLISFIQYARDKQLAVRKRFRISETRLHLPDLLGGWPGGLLAQKIFRHKVSKPGFQVVFIFTAFLNIAFLLYVGASPGYWEQGTYEDYLPVLRNRMEHHLQQFGLTE
ncbi:MAG: DUF1294 domain-containing protein [Kiritimatiellia bacterium]